MCSSNPRPTGSLLHMCDNISIEDVTDIAQDRRLVKIHKLFMIHLIGVVLSKYNAYHTYIIGVTMYITVSNICFKSNFATECSYIYVHVYRKPRLSLFNV